MTDLNNLIAYITGGSKGIGYGIAEKILQNGGKVALTARSQASADKAVNALKESVPGADVLGFEADVRELGAQQKVLDKIKDEWGDTNLVIANAGVGHFASIEDMTEQQWHETMDINLTGVFNTIKASLDQLKETKGYFMTISSLAGTNFFAGGAAYNASKFGLTGFTQAVMLDVRKYGIRTTTIMPGSVSTYFNNHTPSEADAWKIQIEDLGQMVVDLYKLNPRTLPSKVEVRPTMPPSK